jgi:hypothetical protein
MILSLRYLAFSALLTLVVGRRRAELVNDVELIVLRHQLAVLGRPGERPKLRPAVGPSSPRSLACSPIGAGTGLW